MSLEEKIKAIEEEIQKTPYNKATQHHIGKLKAKLAQLKEKRIKRISGKGKGLGFGVRKSGDATIALVGFPSVGKSTLLNKLTDANSRVADYEFTTLEVIPGVMNYKGARIQILDIPGVISGASSGRGRGKELMSIVRTSDLILILLDIRKTGQSKRILTELHDVGIRPNESPPDVRVRRTSRGGVIVTSSKKIKRIERKTIMEILNVNGIHNAEVTLREDMTLERFIDAIMGNRAYIPGIIAINKIDLLEGKEVEGILKNIPDSIAISAENNTNLDQLREEIFKKLDLIRIYMRPQGGKPDYDEPLILKKDSAIEDACRKIHRRFLSKFRYAFVWGKSAKFPGQRVGLSHKLEDEDVLTIVRER